MSIIFMAFVIFYFVFASNFLVLNFIITRVTPFFFFSKFFTFLSWAVHTVQCRKRHHNIPEFSKPVIFSVAFGG